MVTHTHKPQLDYLEIVFDITPDIVTIARARKSIPMVYTHLDLGIQVLIGPEEDNKIITACRRNDNSTLLLIIDPDNQKHKSDSSAGIGDFTKRHPGEPFKRLPPEMMVMNFYPWYFAALLAELPYGIYEMDSDGSTSCIKQY